MIGENESHIESHSGDSLLCIQVEQRDRKLIASAYVETTDAKVVTRKMNFQLDSAATCNMLAKSDYHLLGSPSLHPADTTLELYDGSFKRPLGWCNLKIKGQEWKFNVMATANFSLLSLNTCVALDLLQMSARRVPSGSQPSPPPPPPPVQNRRRKILLSMKKDVKAKIDTLVKNDILDKVDHPTPWISSLQPVRKPNGKICLCIDPHHLNEANHMNHFPMPTLDDVLPELAQAKIFSLCDAKDGFLQIKLSEASSDLTCFWTPFGRYKWKRMPFGITSAPEEFQHRLSNVLDGLPGVTVVADDILIYGKGDSMQEAREDHDNNLQKLLERACHVNLKLNLSKCRFHMT